MSETKSIVVAGSNELAERIAVEASRRPGCEVARWRSPEDTLVSAAPVFVVADHGDRRSFSVDALKSSAQVVALPLSELDDSLVEAIRGGNVRQISRLHGVPALAHLHQQALTGYRGTRYSIFAAHRLPRTSAIDPREHLKDLLVYVASLVGAGVQHVRVTTAALGGVDPDSWFVLARFDDDTVATIEVSSVLSDGSNDSGSLLVEITGSDMVLRAEPDQQSTRINAGGESTIVPWYADVAGGLLDAAFQALEQDRTETQVAMAALLRAVDSFAVSEGEFTITGNDCEAL